VSFILSIYFSEKASCEKGAEDALTVDFTNKCFCPMIFRKKSVKNSRRVGVVRGVGFPAVDILIPKAQITSSRFPFAQVEIFSPI
jgi:hypothetical protein